MPRFTVTVAFDTKEDLEHEEVESLMIARLEGAFSFPDPDGGEDLDALVSNVTVRSVDGD